MKNIKTLVGMAAGVALVGGAVATTAATASAAPAAPAKSAGAVTQTRVLTADAAMKAVQAAQKEAAKQNQRVAIAVVDRSGDLKLVVKGDGAGPQTVESAKRKAYTAVAWGQPTSKLAQNAGGTGPSVRDIPNTLFLAGGVPVASGGAPIAGIGVGGAPQGSIDESIAQAGLNAIANQLG
ncbi:GlcG/HbpS family heme-binding protein [Actinomadura gamaensis]|uniref:Heme-binding protein n=1 Tax=Actinomadura gamaensis TaxID=1763541 RepID=A0ABV9U6L0_9ACTN